MDRRNDRNRRGRGIVWRLAHRARRGAWAGVALVGLTGGVSGCASLSDDCDAVATCRGAGAGGGGAAGGSTGPGGGGEGGGGAAPCVPGATPSEGGCLDEGIFVRRAGNDDADGSAESPVATLGRAIDLAAASGTPVYACAEVFDEQLTVPAGITIFGGLDCDDGWRWSAATPTTVAPSGGGQVPLVLLAGEARSQIEDLALVAPDATTPGQSSIAAQARGAAATLRRCVFQAGAGAPGAPGTHAPSAPPPTAPAGNPGTPGYCSDSTNTAAPGGALVVSPGCGTSVGGKGGDGSTHPDVAGQSGAHGSPTGTGTGLGAPPQPSSGAWSCPNRNGTNGNPGEPGAGAFGLGFLSPTGHYVGVPGAPGAPGAPGVGGGGGGGGRPIACPGYFFANGPGGGGGGAGGCGGAGGGGGGAGGSSIALVSVAADLTLEDCLLAAGAAGAGGPGGDGQPGAAGGLGGAGPQGTSTSFCRHGGDGGGGGPGGAGGGGAGGHAVAIAYTGDAPSLAATSMEPGDPGAGGTGGAGAPPTSAGADGTAAPALELATP